MKLVSLFTGCGGLDLGFERASFEIIWANEYDKSIWATFENNFPHVFLDKSDIRKIHSSEIPKNVVGIIGGPPCQSWSEAGSRRGIHDQRGQLFFEYLRVLNSIKPPFFLAENVSGILHPKNREAFNRIIEGFEKIGYRISYKLLNANDYGVPQDRDRVVIVGYKKELGMKFEFPQPNPFKPTLKDAIYNMPEPVQGKEFNKTNRDTPKLSNHEYMHGGFSSIYMSRNRVRSWNEASFTIQAGGRHAPLHPQASKMIFISQNKRIFDPKSPKPYRRLSIRECARIQTFPDKFIFHYNYLADGYKMIGNAVPVNLACAIACKISSDLKKIMKSAQIGTSSIKIKSSIENPEYKQNFNNKEETSFQETFL